MPRAPCDFAFCQGPQAPFLAVGHSLKLPAIPALAPARFTRAQQLADPAAPRTRVVKDVLRTGRWQVGATEQGAPIWWDVTPGTLAQIAANFATAQANGVAVNLCWGHGAPGSIAVDARDCIAPLDQVLASGDVLWATAYVTPADADRLRNPAMKASVRVMDDFTDGAGRVYPILLLHVAVVDQPVVAGQGPFHKDLSLFVRDLFLQEKQPMPLDFERTKAAVNQLLANQNVALPDDVTADNFNDALDLIVSILAQPDDGAQARADAGFGTGAEALVIDPTATMGRSLSNTLGQQLAPIVQAVRDLSVEVAQLKQGQSRQPFLEELKHLAATGCIDARTRLQLEATGAKTGYDLSILAPFAQLQMVDLSRQAQRFADGTPPDVNGVSPPLTPEQIAAAAKSLGARIPVTH